MSIDLKKLPQSLREGKRLPQEDDRVVIVTPLFRAAYPVLKEPKKSKNYPDQPAKYGITMLWNFQNSDDDALIDARPVLLPAIGEVARAARLDPKKVLNRGDDDSFKNDDDTWKSGFGPGIRFATARCNDRPTVLDAANNEIDPLIFKPGFYGRAVIGIYSAFGKVNFWLEQVQLIARGEVIGGVRREFTGAFDSVGGDDFSKESPMEKAPGAGEMFDDEGY